MAGEKDPIEVFDKLSPYIKKATQAQDKSLGVTKETSPELQKSFAEKLSRISGGPKGGGSGSGVGNVADIKMLQNPKAMKSGGKVRGHGCEVRGKTKGKFV